MHDQAEIGDLIPNDYFSLPTVEVARRLIGFILYRQTNEGTVWGRIVETEAYLSKNDPACHAARGRTLRNATMFGPPGRAYVYLIYGLYHCLNVVTAHPDQGEAVLIRAVEPLGGIALMRRRRGATVGDLHLASGPGKLCAAFAIDRSLDGHDLSTSPLYLRLGPCIVPNHHIAATRRIGITRATEKKLRFILSGSPFLSRTAVS